MHIYKYIYITHISFLLLSYKDNMRYLHTYIHGKYENYVHTCIYYLHL